MQMTAEKLLGALGLARRAGALAAGFDAVCEAAACGKAKLVLLCGDTSERTRRKTREACAGFCTVADAAISQWQAAALCGGKPTGVLAVNDENLARLCAGALPDAGAETS